jgi:hypothetical protein
VFLHAICLLLVIKDSFLFIERKYFCLKLICEGVIIGHLPLNMGSLM